MSQGIPSASRPPRVDQASARASAHAISRAVARASARQGQRGATIFVIVLLMTMLLGIGLFAARSASFSTAASGNARQMTQAQYLAEYGVLLSRAELDDTKAVQAWRNLALNPPSPSPCYGQSQMLLPRCAIYCSSKAQAKLGAQGQNVIDATSFGTPDTEGSFCVQLTDWTPADTGLPGTDANLTSYNVTATSVAMIRHTPQANDVGATSGTQMSRAHFTTVPIPGK